MTTTTTTATIIATLAMGYYFGLQTAGRMAYQGAEFAAPSWLDTVQTLTTLTLAIFTVSIALAVISYIHDPTSTADHSWEHGRNE